jgi:hypothetical protein
MKYTRNQRLISSKLIFVIFLITIAVISLTVFLTGLDIKRSIYENTLITLTILSTSFFCFLTGGLYFGIKLKDTVGKLTDKIKFVEPGGQATLPDISEGGGAVLEAAGGDGCEGLIVGIIAWLAITVFVIFFLVFFETVLWAGIMIVGAALYWVFFRATRLVLKNGNKCKNDLYNSSRIGLIYTVLYASWIYLIVFGLQYWKK